MAGRTILETSRLLLREHAEADAEAFFALASDPDVTRYLGVPALTSVEEAREVLIAHPLADYRKHGFGRWAVIDKATGEMVGYSGLKHLEELGEVDVAWVLRPDRWGRGLATEAGRASLAYGFDRLALGHIIALIEEGHAASARVAAKLGLTWRDEVTYRGNRLLRYVIEAPRGG